MNQNATTNELGAKAKVKSEIYRLLSTEWRVFLLPSNEANHNFISDVISGKRKVPKSC